MVKNLEMHNFKRGQSTKKSLHVGNNVFYREMWKKEMPNLKDCIPAFAKEMAINYDFPRNYGKMNFKTGYFNFYEIDFDFGQEEERIFTISLEDFINKLREIEAINLKHPF